MVADFTVLFGKAFSGLLLPTLMGDNQFTSPFVVLIVLVFCVSLPTQIYLIDQSLTVNDALYHIPNFYVFWNVGSIITGAIYYEEMKNFKMANWLGFFSGVGILFMGVYLTNIAAEKKMEMAEAEEKKRNAEEWNGGAGNEDGLNAMHDDEAWYAQMWEQAIAGSKATEGSATELDERGVAMGEVDRVDSSNSLRDVTLGELRPGAVPETVSEDDEEVMANLMRSLQVHARTHARTHTDHAFSRANSCELDAISMIKPSNQNPPADRKPSDPEPQTQTLSPKI